jgi:hypothetical protein
MPKPCAQYSSAYIELDNEDEDGPKLLGDEMEDMDDMLELVVITAVLALENMELELDDELDELDELSAIFSRSGFGYSKSKNILYRPVP